MRQPSRVSPVAFAISSVNRIFASFHPGAMPRLSRAHYRRELMAWFFLPAMLGAVEGGVVGVLAKNAFEGVIDNRRLNLAVAVLAGAPALANVTSFIWAALGHGRAKIRLLVGMQLATAAFVGSIALAPRSGQGLLLIVSAVIGARVCWSGVLIIRSTIWAVNYPRSDRATLAGKLATVQALVLTAVAAIIGAAMNYDTEAYRYIYPAAVGMGLVGIWIYSGLRVRGHRALLRAERQGGLGRTQVNPMAMWRVLRADDAYRRYMVCMFIFGFGNLMLSAPLVIMLRDRFELGAFTSILIVASIPTLLMPASIPWWSKRLDDVHIVQFRAVHSWAFVLSIASFLLGALTMQIWLLFVGAVVQGIAFGGGVLGWNLGHLDFAPPHRASQYMGVHVTLTGVRGLLAPLLAVWVYEMLESLRPGTGPWALALSLALSLSGAIGFIRLARTMRKPGPAV